MITLKVDIQNENVAKKVLWFLDSLKDQGIEVQQENFKINVEQCLQTLKNINNHDDFEPIDDIDEHIKKLKNATDSK
ncbi:MAG: hypothetical protein KAG43_07270 [Candidatus Marithrix sp.]|nr:hypothetical protein [Candidatus Marithrix sp.]